MDFNSQEEFPARRSIAQPEVTPAEWLWDHYHRSHASFDKAFIEKWKNDLDGVLVFTGLFSAMVSGFFIDSWRSLQPDPERKIVHLLTNISAILTANASETQSLISNSPPEPFTVSPRDLRANLFFMYSLFFSVTCALAATLLQRWVCMFTQDVTELPVPGSALGRRRAVTVVGARRFFMTAVAENMPFFLHISVFLFFIGFIEYLKAINDLLADTMFGLVMYMSVAYAILTIFPLIWRDCPYQTPLSFVLWRVALVTTFIATILAKVVLKIRAKVSSRPTRGFFDEPPNYYKTFTPCLGEFTARARADGQLRVSDAMALIDFAGLLKHLDDKKRFLEGMIAFFHSCGAVPGKTDILPCDAMVALKYLADHSAPIISVIISILSSYDFPPEDHKDEVDPSIQACMEAFRFITFRFSSHDKCHTPRVVFFRSMDDIKLDNKVVPILGRLSRSKDDLIAVTARSMLALIAAEAVHIASLSVGPEKAKLTWMIKHSLRQFCPVGDTEDNVIVLRDGPYACVTSLLDDVLPHIDHDASLAYIVQPVLRIASASAQSPPVSEAIRSALDELYSVDLRSLADGLTCLEEPGGDKRYELFKPVSSKSLEAYHVLVDYTRPLHSAACPTSYPRTPSMLTRLFTWVSSISGVENGHTMSQDTYSVHWPSRQSSGWSECYGPTNWTVRSSQRRSSVCVRV